MFRLRTLVLVAVAGCLLAPPAARADIIVIGAPATGSNDIPFGIGPAFGPATRYQQVYNASLFPSSPIIITEIAFPHTVMPGGNIDSATYEVHLSTTSRPVNGLDTINFNSNVGPNDQVFLPPTVLGGPLPGTTPLVLTGSPFVYDPSAGNLLLDVFKAGGDPFPVTPLFLDARNGDFGSASSRADNFGPGFTSTGLVTQFTIPVPEPGTWALFGIGALGLLACKRLRAPHRRADQGRHAAGTPPSPNKRGGLPMRARPFLLAVALFLGVMGRAKADYIFTTLDPPGSVQTQFLNATGINASGQIVGQYDDAGGTRHGFLLSGGSFTTLDAPGSHFTIAYGINASGQIVGLYYDNIPAVDTHHAFLLSGGSYTTLTPPGSTSTGATGINASGQIVGGYIPSGIGATEHGFLLSGGTYTTFDPPGSSFTGIYAGINDSGQVVGQYRDAGDTSRGYLLSEGIFTTFDAPGATFTVASGINDSGQIVGWFQAPAGSPNHGFLLSGGTFTPFDVPGSTSTTARGINASGQIVGVYTDAGGRQHGFLATPAPIPEPSTFLLFGVGALGVYAWRRRKQGTSE
jgi:probable HAF family extracellular repeat protein